MEIQPQREPTGRQNHDIRPINIELQVNRYAEGSTLIKVGHTHVLCTASIEEQVPHWLKGQGKGWITAEYSLLPRATHSRNKRDREKVSGRTHEIQRLISRALRSCLQLSELGEKSIIIDCDVLQADGGTRTAAITGGCVALAQAIGKLIEAKKLKPTIWLGSVAAISLGIKNNQILVDLDYQEDSSCEVDMNFVMTKNQQFVEVQGTGEKTTFSPFYLQQMTTLAINAIGKTQQIQKQAFQKSEFSKWIDF